MTASKPCPACAGEGFVVLLALEPGPFRPGARGYDVGRRRVTFRAPCYCAAGGRWLHNKRRGTDDDEEDDDEDDDEDDEH